MPGGPIATNSNLKEARITIPQHVVHRVFPTETVLLNLNTGRYHGLDPTAGTMFEVIAESENLSQAAASLSEDRGLPLDVVARDLQDLCLSLIDQGLLEAVEK